MMGWWISSQSQQENPSLLPMAKSWNGWAGRALPEHSGILGGENQDTTAVPGNKGILKFLGFPARKMKSFSWEKKFPPKKALVHWRKGKGFVQKPKLQVLLELKTSRKQQKKLNIPQKTPFKLCATKFQGAFGSSKERTTNSEISWKMLIRNAN